MLIFFEKDFGKKGCSVTNDDEFFQYMAIFDCTLSSADAGIFGESDSVSKVGRFSSDRYLSEVVFNHFGGAELISSLAKIVLIQLEKVKREKG